ncbi:MAG: transglycosylase domain-containing protein [Anaerolineales bacterium]|nr:transglycosylase domain-containing protein [Anaerolineales bacterium]
MSDWHTPDGDAFVNREQWFTPPDAISEPPAEPEAPPQDFEPGPNPVRPGGWYSPQASYDFAPAAALGEILGWGEFSALEFNPSGVVAQPQPEPQAELEPEPQLLELEAEVLPPEEELEAVEQEFLDAPQVEGEVPLGFADAPSVPLSANLDTGFGGLRDIPIEEEPEPEPEPQGLTLEEAAHQHDTVQPLEVPAQGVGGLQGATVVDHQVAVSLDANATHLLSGTANAEPQVQANQQPSQPMSSNAQRFREVEQSVQSLRQQFAEGRITRSQLEGELRRLMVLDDQGRWWTLGVDSSRWYRYDGREWIPDTPPQTGAQPPITPDYVRTETGVQPPVAPQQFRPTIGETQPPTPAPKIALDEYGMPLPAKVPQEDPGATMVNLNAATSDTPPYEYERTAPGIERPGPHDPREAATIMPGSQDARTISPAEAAAAVAPMVGGDPYQQEKNMPKDNQPVGKPKMEGVQPDYSEALGGVFTRSGMTKMVVWSSVGGTVIVLGMTFCVLVAMVMYYFSVVSDYSAAIDDLPQRASTFQTTTIYASDGQTVLAEFNDPNRGVRQKVALEDISPWAIHALVSTEDETYYENPGFSVFAILRSTYTNLTSAGPQSGASTITQQIARRLLLNEEFAAQISAERKVTEIVLAAEISRKYSKDEILELYFNEMSFGGFTVGIEAASQAYFKKPASDLNVFEAALLIGQVQSPGVYDPFQNREAALGRMETVLRLMEEANGDGCIQMEHTTNVSGFDLSQPLCVTESYLVNEVPHLKAIVEITDFTPPIQELKYAHFVYWVWDQVRSRYGEDYIYNNGLRVTTTLDLTLQETAQTQVREQVATSRNAGINVNNGSLVSLDPTTGAILAMVGSADFSNQDIDGEVNVALNPRQPGSSIKPLVYLTAFEGYVDDTGVWQYWTPATVVWDTQSSWGSYTPVNYDGEYRGPRSVRLSLANSLNVPAVKAMAFVTPERFTDVANRMGVTFPLQSPVTAGLPSALGAAEVRLMDMVAGYAAFANGGFYNQPFGIYSIQTANGEYIFDWQTDLDPAYQTVDPRYAFLINSILSDNQARREEFGTNYARLDLPDGRPAAVKTGTTNDNRDAWTIGWTPQIITAVWMGNTVPSSMGNSGTGYNLASPVWNKVMWQYVSNLDIAQFSIPAGIEQRTVCRDSGTQLPQNNAELCGPGGTITDYFLVDQPPPPGEESLFQVVMVDAFTNRIANQFCPDYQVEKFFLVVDDPTVIPWIRNTAAGQTWAQSRDLDPNSLDGVMPTESCTPDQPAPISLLTSPFNGMTISGLATFYGTATVPSFDHYEIQYTPASAPDQYQVIPGQSYQFEQSGQGAVLGTWPTNSLSDGVYFIRLATFSQTGAVALSAPVQVTITNAAPAVPQPEANAAESGQ